MPSNSELTEAQFQRQVTAALELHGWRWYHTHDSRRSPAGFPDIIATKGRVLLAIELKRQSGKVSPEQYEWLEALKATGARACVLRPSHWDMFMRLIGQNGDKIE